jgi:hypothetical protein
MRKRHYAEENYAMFLPVARLSGSGKNGATDT